jgi:predicted GH43/DUF377 family glycosyl hydrolase
MNADRPRFGEALAALDRGAIDSLPTRPVRRVLSVLTCGLLAVACGNGEDSAASGDAAPRSTAPVLSVEYGDWILMDAPVLPRGPEGAWDSGLVDPGAMIFHQGRFHMLYNGIPSWPHPLAVGYASSLDGLEWERRAEAPVFAPDPVPFGGWTVRANSVVVEDDVWVLYFSVGPRGRLEGTIGRAVAPGPSGPWQVDPDPVLTPGAPGTWDAESVGEAKVLPDAVGYVMYYTGRAAGRGAIGRALSSDGIAWTRDPRPVLEAPVGESDQDEFAVSDPTVIRTPDSGWLMTYRLTRGPGTTVLGTATSRDGVRWTRQAPAVRSSSDTETPFDAIFFNNVQATHTHQIVYFEGADPAGGRTDVWAAHRTVRVGMP